MGECLMKIYIITGGVGFIGSHFVRQILRSEQDIKVINLDIKLI